MTVEANVLPSRRRQGALTLVVCEYLHVESEMSRRLSFSFPVGMNVVAACTALIPVVESFFEEEERDLWNRRVRDRGFSRDQVVGIIISTNQALKYVLEQAAVADGQNAAKYNRFVQEFTDTELAQALSITQAAAAAWQQNSARNAAAVQSVKDYVGTT